MPNLRILLRVPFRGLHLHQRIIRIRLCLIRVGPGTMISVLTTSVRGLCSRHTKYSTHLATVKLKIRHLKRRRALRGRVIPMEVQSHWLTHPQAQTLAIPTSNPQSMRIESRK